jgi:hypothetical protein
MKPSGLCEFELLPDVLIGLFASGSFLNKETISRTDVRV